MIAAKGWVQFVHTFVKFMMPHARNACGKSKNRIVQWRGVAMRPFCDFLKNINQRKPGSVMRPIISLFLVLLLSNITLAESENEFDNQLTSSPGVRFINFSSISGAVGENSGMYGFKIINGALIKNIASIGFGIGFDKYSDGSLVPVFGDIRFFPDFQGNHGAYFFADVGYSLDREDLLTDTEKVGFYFNGGVGLVMLTRGVFGLTVDAGYKIQRVTHYWNRSIINGNNYYYDSGYNAANHNYFSLSAGITF
jgi:hypothetical protein